MRVPCTLSPTTLNNKKLHNHNFRFYCKGIFHGIDLLIYSYPRYFNLFTNYYQRHTIFLNLFWRKTLRFILRRTNSTINNITLLESSGWAESEHAALLVEFLAMTTKYWFFVPKKNNCVWFVTYQRCFPNCAKLYLGEGCVVYS